MDATKQILFSNCKTSIVGIQKIFGKPCLIEVTEKNFFTSKKVSSCKEAQISGPF